MNGADERYHGLVHWVSRMTIIPPYRLIQRLPLLGINQIIIGDLGTPVPRSHALYEHHIHTPGLLAFMLVGQQLFRLQVKVGAWAEILLTPGLDPGESVPAFRLCHLLVDPRECGMDHETAGEALWGDSRTG